MNLLEFNDIFHSENACKLYLKEQREKVGIVCRKCGNAKHYWLESQGAWKCAACKSWTNLKAGTIMEQSKLRLRTWFMCIHLMTSIKKSFSANEMQKQLGCKRYEPVWYMMQKIRCAMGKRDAKYKLKGTVEMDDAFFEIVDLKRDKQASKSGRGSTKQCGILVMVESEPKPMQSNPYKKKRSMGFAKMIVLDDRNNSAGINYEVERAIDKESEVLTDAYQGFSRLKNIVRSHKAEIIPSKEAHKKLPWVHTVIANAKRLFLGTHHSIGKAYLQLYLNEYCYKLNRRNFKSDLFDRMITAGINSTWY